MVEARTRMSPSWKAIRSQTRAGMSSPFPMRGSPWTGITWMVMDGDFPFPEIKGTVVLPEAPLPMFHIEPEKKENRDAPERTPPDPRYRPIPPRPDVSLGDLVLSPRLLGDPHRRGLRGHPRSGSIHPLPCRSDGGEQPGVPRMGARRLDCRSLRRL